MKPISGISTGKRTALVVGNAAYQSASPLRNPINDANAMTAALKTLGFEVVKHVNTNRQGMEQAINDWGKTLWGYDVALFFYAGHGAEVNGINYLFPTDANPLNASQARFQATPVELVTGWMEEAKVKTNILLLDACRDNPFTRSWSRGGAPGGFATMNAPSGTFIGFATQPGKTAADGDRTNGLYTEAILRTIQTPNLTIDQIFNRVNAYVRQGSGGGQIPFKNSSLEADFYFSATDQPVAQQEPRKAEPAPIIPTEPTTRAFLDLPFAEMAYIPGGIFQMGDTRGEGIYEEKPVHDVTVSSFWMGKYEITQRQWMEIMGDNPSYFKDCEDCPVEQVSWEDVQAFLVKLNARTGGRYRLPTEAEWEYAAGGGTGTRTRFGNGKDVADPREMNFDGSANSKKAYSLAGEYRGKTVKAGSFSPNGLGLYDMTGNVGEWCSDWYGDYTGVRQTDPTGAVSGSYRVLRGGSWNYFPLNSRVAYRDINTPSNRDTYVGFRVVAPQ
jgi:formylglycine-generating enzyme required for sulfatase activity